MAARGTAQPTTLSCSPPVCPRRCFSLPTTLCHLHLHGCPWRCFSWATAGDPAGPAPCCPCLPLPPQPPGCPPSSPRASRRCARACWARWPATWTGWSAGTTPRRRRAGTCSRTSPRSPRRPSATPRRRRTAPWWAAAHQALAVGWPCACEGNRRHAPAAPLPRANTAALPVLLVCAAPHSVPTPLPPLLPAVPAAG